MDIDIDHDLEVQHEGSVYSEAIADIVLRCQHLLLLLIIILAQIIQLSQQIFSTAPHIPHHTSVLTGHAWVLELMSGHPDHIKINLGVSLEVFQVLIHVLNENHFDDSKNGVTVEEQLAIFLYTCIMGMSSCLVTEWFQCSTDTITK